MKKMKVATIVIIMIMVVYATALVILNHYDKLPVEKILMIFTAKWQIQLPFEVSCWWNLLLTPIFLLTAVYRINQDEIIGKESYSQNQNIGDKYHARNNYHFLILISMTFFAAVLFMGMIMHLVFPTGGIGPLSLIVSSVLVFIGCYVMFGAFVEFVQFLLNDSFDDRDDTERYLSISTKYIKIGLIKTLPFLIGLTVGFILRFVIMGIIKFFGSIKIVKVKNA